MVQRRPFPPPYNAPPSAGNADPLGLPFLARDLVFTDTETTGVDSAVDRVVEIAMVRVSMTADGLRFTRFQSLVNPGFPIPPAAMAVHNITDEMVADAPSFDEIADSVAAMLDGAIPVAHHADLDASMISAEMTDAGKTAPAREDWLCTYRLSRHLFEGAPAHGNNALRYWLKLNPKSEGLGAHRAMDDILVTMEIAWAQMREALKVGRASTADELVALANSRIPIKVMPITVHAGKPMEEVPLDFIRWALGMLPGKPGMTNLDRDLRGAMEAQLDRGDREVAAADVMTFGIHRDKPISTVPLQYLEWIERERPRACPEPVLKGVLLELKNRRDAAPSAPNGGDKPAAEAHPVRQSSFFTPAPQPQRPVQQRLTESGAAEPAPRAPGRLGLLKQRDIEPDDDVDPDNILGARPAGDAPAPFAGAPRVRRNRP